jgi:hypothetical protein
MVETSSTRSIARKLAVRSVPPCGRAISSISFSTSAWLGEGSPMTTRGGSPMTTTLMASPRRASRTSCEASVLACSKRVVPAVE